jgi:dienelactone hydrolase
MAIQLWYPASPHVHGALARYIANPALAAALLAQDYYGLDSQLLRTWPHVTTHSYVNAQPLAGRHPTVTLSPGLGVARANYTSLAEELASYGYIVIGIDLPLQGFTILPDGAISTADDDSANSSDDAAVQRRQVSAWAADISFVLDRLQQEKVSVRAAAVARGIDWSRVGAFGHSSGGLISIEACGHDERLRACADLDGGPLDPDGHPIADFVSAGLKKPSLFLMEHPVYSDADLARRHRTRASYERQDPAFTAMMNDLEHRAEGPFYFAHVTGTGHFSFSDGPFMMPTTITRFGGRIIDAGRGWRVITTTLRAFFDEYLSTTRGSSLVRLTKTFPELVFDRAKLQ